MNITEISPSGRKFNLELSEDELRTLGILMGNISRKNIEDQILMEKDSKILPKIPAKQISYDIYNAVEKICSIKH